MVDAPSLTASTPQLTQPPGFDSAIAARMKKNDAIAGQEKTAADSAKTEIADVEARADARDKPIEDQQQQAFSKMQETLDSLKHPPQMEQPKQTSPQQMWASNAMVFAALASLVTRRPLVTAMNSASKALEAFTTGNQEAVNAAFQKWKMDSENFYKVADAQQNVYKGLMEDARFRLEESGKTETRELTNIESNLRATATALQDEQIANATDIRGMVDIYTARERGVQTMQESGQKVEQSLLYQQGMAEFKKAHPNATNDELIHQSGELVKQIGKPWDDQQIQAEADRFDRMASNNPIGKNYSASFTHLGMISSYDPNRPPDQKTVIEQAAVLDNAVQSLNGNRAMRGFQLQLMQHEMGLLNKVEQMAQQVKGGGPVTREMIQAMQEVATNAAHIATLQYGDYITSFQWGVGKNGLDPTLFTPPDFHPEQDPIPEGPYGPYANPLADDPATKRNVEFLKSHNTRDNWLHFDDHYGPGAAALVMAPVDEDSVGQVVTPPAEAESPPQSNG